MLLTGVLLLIALQLLIRAAGGAKSGAWRVHDYRYHNREPRVWLEHKPDLRRRRTSAAQSSSFESLPLIFAHANRIAINGLRMAWASLRSVYRWLYVTARARMRSRMGAIALVINLALFFSPSHG